MKDAITFAVRTRQLYHLARIQYMNYIEQVIARAMEYHEDELYRYTVMADF
ncbi:hypothetical protein [Geoglobus acetivorans]|uniref:Uncharacterized protein n=1 Tax=Geoglobus acetivorans TaxID=565033 RepID=A0A0A7GFE4_GEOAI|nr:hypothetical protein GACE_0610 [Geoglobus acetivorans]